MYNVFVIMCLSSIICTCNNVLILHIDVAAACYYTVLLVALNAVIILTLYVCMYVCIYIYIYIHTYIWLSSTSRSSGGRGTYNILYDTIYIYIYLSLYIYIERESDQYVCICVYIYVYTYIYIYICTHKHIYIYI